jgi:hypothetical protein
MRYERYEIARKRDKRFIKILRPILVALVLVCITGLLLSVATAVETGDYAFDAETGALTIKTQTGMTAWKADGSGISIEAVRSLNVNIGSGVATIPASAFEDCVNLTSAAIQTGVTAISQFAFYDCTSLERIDIPIGLDKIGVVDGYDIVNPDKAFINCNKLEAIDVDSDNTAYKSEDGVLFNKDKTLLLIYPGGKKDTHYTVPAGVIYLYSFSSNKYLESVTMADSVGTIGLNAFDYCTALYEVNFRSGLTSISTGAFRACNSLKTLVLPDSVTTIGTQALPPALEVLTLPANLSENAPVNGVLQWLAADCRNLRKISIPNGSPYYKSTEDGVLFSKSGDTLYLYPPNKPGDEYTIPGDVKTITKGAFEFNRNLERVDIHASVGAIGVHAFANTVQLSHIDIAEGSELKTIGDGAFSKDIEDDVLLDLYLPRSLSEMGWYTFADPDYGERLDQIPVRLFVYYDSAIREYCDEKSMPYYLRPDAAFMQAYPPDLMYQFIPYQFTPVTKVASNAGLEFWIERDLGAGYVRADLPQGLTLWNGDPNAYPATFPPGLLPGTIYGAPKDYAPFVDGVAFRLCVRNLGDVNNLFVATADFTLKLAERLATDAEWEQKVNDFAFLPTLTDTDGKIDDLSGAIAAVANQVMHIDGNYLLFDSFWIDGVKKTETTHYTAEDGSTRVTVLAQTLKDLDNGSHTAAAAFRSADGIGQSSKGNDLDVVAQNFAVNLTGRNTGTGGTGGSSDSSTDSSSAADNPKPTEADQATTTPEPAPQTDNASASEPVPEPAPQADGTPVPAPAQPAARPAAQPAGAPPAPPENPVAAEEDPATEASARPEAAPEITGFATDENGDFYFDTGDGVPMELRIDLPFAEFEDLYADGALWRRDADYSARSGSTILTVAADRLEALSAGRHSLTAVFANQSVEIPFTLHTAQDAGASDGPASFLPALIAILLCVGAAICAAALFAARRRRAHER